MNRGEVWSVSLNPTRGSEQNGTRPALIISPDTMNNSLDTKVVIPLTRTLKAWPSRVNTQFKSQTGQAMCEQIRTISSKRLHSYLGNLSSSEIVQVLCTVKALYGEA